MKEKFSQLLQYTNEAIFEQRQLIISTEGVELEDYSVKVINRARHKCVKEYND